MYKNFLCRLLFIDYISLNHNCMIYDDISLFNGQFKFNTMLALWCTTLIFI